MGCLDENEPSVCPWWETVFDVPTTRRAKKDCEAGDKVACLVSGLGAIGRGARDDAAQALVKSCDANEPLACIYLAYTHLVCSRNALKGSAVCPERLENYFDDKKSEATLVSGCDAGLGVGCYVLGHILWPREDNKVPWLDRGCRLGMVGACRTLYDELESVIVQPAPAPRRLAMVRIRLMELCDADAVDCYEIADDLAGLTHMPARQYIDRACDPKRTPHMPKTLCGPKIPTPHHD